MTDDEIKAALQRAGFHNDPHSPYLASGSLQNFRDLLQQSATEIPFNEHTKKILGRMCFQCIRIAQAMREKGAQIDTQAEDEQAAAIHFLLSMYLKHGEKWAVAAAAELA